MIKIIDSKNNITVELQGNIARTPTKRGFVATQTAIGINKTEHIRSVIDINITIEYIDIDNYGLLEKIFMSSNNSIDIEDTDRSVYYSNYNIDGETMSLTEGTDIGENVYFYTGNIVFKKR